MRLIFVPHTGQGPWAARRPLAISTSSPSKSRFSRHFTQYPLYVAIHLLLVGFFVHLQAAEIGSNEKRSTGDSGVGQDLLARLPHTRCGIAVADREHTR